MENATNCVPRHQKTPLREVRPGILLELGQQRSDRTVRHSSEASPSLALPVLAAEEEEGGGRGTRSRTGTCSWPGLRSWRSGSWLRRACPQLHPPRPARRGGTGRKGGRRSFSALPLYVVHAHTVRMWKFVISSRPRSGSFLFSVRVSLEDSRISLRWLILPALFAHGTWFFSTSPSFLVVLVLRDVKVDLESEVFPYSSACLGRQ